MELWSYVFGAIFLRLLPCCISINTPSVELLLEVLELAGGMGVEVVVGGVAEEVG